ncbi:hypothetical protein BA190_32870 [Labrys sp. WJW]|uniref:ABC transporter ATP-binding protein n=1 Tax=Labrys sp. WJW TaxID=1737983 RepID=UPI000831FC29|nr:ABC transporter ATP-binding protein [Labrys sp. WJW]OCC00655.1 hypothetical protein BA190_32870 [Labrys sp. WJW]
MLPADAVLRVRELCVTYRHRPVLRQISPSPFLPGTITALVGPNGAGKSTLLRALAGLVPAIGSAMLADKDLLGLSPFERARWISFMPQASPYGGALTAIETVMAAARIAPSPASGSPRHRPEWQAGYILDKLGILGLATSRIDQLSGGQRQLVSLAQTIVNDAPCLLLDEPTSALDLRYQHQVMQHVRDLAGRGHIVIVVLHDLSLANQWADRIIVLEAGQLYREGPPVDVLNAEMLRDVYKVRADVNVSPLQPLQIHIHGSA